MSLMKDLVKMEQEITKTKSLISEHSELIKNYSTNIAREHSAELDSYIRKIQKILQKLKDKEMESYSDHYLELQIIALPTILYDAVEGLEDLGSQQDLAKIHKDSKYSDIFNGLTEGTIPDKENQAKQQVLAETLMLEIYKRAYTKLKRKFDVALELHASLKKALDNRIKSKEVFRRDNSLPDMGYEIEQHEGQDNY